MGALLCDRPGPSSMVSPPCSGLGHLQVAPVPRKRGGWWSVPPKTGTVDLSTPMAQDDLSKQSPPHRLKSAGGQADTERTGVSVGMVSDPVSVTRFPLAVLIRCHD